MLGGGAPKPAHDGPQRVERPAGETPHQVDSDGDGQYETSYFELKKEFTSNLMDPNRYIQVGLGVATTYDSKVTEAVEKNDPAIRSAIRSEERRGGKECFSTGRSRWSRYLSKKKKYN